MSNNRKIFCCGLKTVLEIEKPVSFVLLLVISFLQLCKVPDFSNLRVIERTLPMGQTMRNLMQLEREKTRSKISGLDKAQF